MPRAKKDSRRVNFNLDKGIYGELEAYAQAQGQTITTAIERILGSYLRQTKDKEASWTE